MVNTKTINVQKILIFVFLVVFPFGQLLRTDLLLGDFHLVLHPIDIVVGVLSFFYLVKRVLTKRPIWGYATGFISALIFSYLFSLSIFNGRGFSEGLFYLLRIIAYLIFPFVIGESIGNSLRTKEIYYKALILISVFIGLFGWVQYILYPDVRPLLYLGWDDHLYRIVGTFLDPGFTGLLLVLGINLSLVMFFKKTKAYWFLIILFLLSSLLFTYSRAGYISILGSIVIYFWAENKKKLLLPVFILFFIFILLLPRPSSSGVQLERIYSVILRIKNYQETVRIWTRWPIFGVGYNNMCQARIVYLGEENALSHSCSGSDSSLLLLLTTTGFVGLMIFIKMIKSMIKNVAKDIYGTSFIICLVSILIHSLFVNSLFYPWVMGYLGILYSLAVSISNSEG